MNSQRDMYIKEIFQKDQLISNKADDIFNNFFNDNVTEEKVQEEKVINIDDYKKARTPRKFMTAVASLAIVFLVGNTYASTQGYDNIFFAIKDWTSNIIKEVKKEEILTDREIIISYQNIKITDKTKIQVNKINVQYNEAKLFIRVNAEAEDNLSKIPMNFIVTDLSNNEEKIIATQKTEQVEANKVFTEAIDLKGFSENTQRVKVELQTNNYVSLCTLEIDLLEKQIDIIDGKKVTLKKISEIDLKEKLGIYIGYKNFLEDFAIEITDENLDKYQNEAKLMVANYLVMQKHEISGNMPTVDEINKALEEFCGDKITNYIETAGIIMEYNNETKNYEYVVAGDYNPFGLCLEIENISFINGNYIVEFAYCRPSEDDYLNGTIEELPVLRETLTFELNKEPQFTEYCITSL